MSDSSDTNPTPDMIEQAAQWAARLDAGDMSQGDRIACDEWCREHSLHRRTLERMRAFDARVANAQDFEREALNTVLARRRSRLFESSLLGVAVLVVAGWAGMQSDYVRDRFPDYQTGRGELRTASLDDGSEIVLDTNGAIRVDMRGARRQVRLIRGQLLAKVAKDPTRPFVVETADGTATALGTSFLLRREADYTLVTVIESRVRVCPGKIADEKECRILAAGERAHITPKQIFAQSSIDPSVAALWSSGWLEADDQDVADVLTELARYSERPIRFDRASLRGVKVTGSFPLRDIDRAAEGIARSAALRVHRSVDGGIAFTRQR
ncbi:FecR domain-containing protein [Sphingomonas sp. HH69]